jgi:hypothetical protein
MIKAAEVELLLQRGFTLTQPLVWSLDGHWWKVRAPVESPHDVRVALDLNINSKLLWKYTYQLRLGSQPIRRLCVRGSHRNRCGGSTESWISETHKHRYTDECGDSFAYAPSPFPATPDLTVTPSEYREVFEAFCDECNIERQVEWVEPRWTAIPLSLDEGEEP